MSVSYWNGVLKNILGRRKLSDFLVFFVFTSALWLLIKLSESHNATLSFEIKYVSVPEDKILLGDPDNFLNVAVKGGGYAILKHRFFNKKIELDVSRAELLNGNYKLTAQYLEAAVKEQLDKNLSFQSLQVNTIALNLGKNSKRKIPVLPDIDFSFERDFDIYGALEVNPDSITVNGPENLVDTLTVLRTNKIVMTDVNSDINIQAGLFINKALQEVSFSTKQVIIRAQVVRFTEKILEVPVIVTNKPENLSIRLFPESLKIRCKGSLSDLKKVMPNDLLVTADFSKTSEAGILIPVLEKYPGYLRSAQIMDKKVEFLIKKE